MTIREATAADADAIVALGQRFLHGSVYAGKIGDNPAQVRTLALHLIASPDGVVFVAEDATGLVGLLAAFAHFHYLSGERTAGEVAWWVDVEKRGIGIRLLRRAEQWARAQGAVTFQMIAPTPDVEVLYERLGYAPVERWYQRSVA